MDTLEREVMRRDPDKYPNTPEGRRQLAIDVGMRYAELLERNEAWKKMIHGFRYMSKNH